MSLRDDDLSVTYICGAIVIFYNLHSWGVGQGNHEGIVDCSASRNNEDNLSFKTNGPPRRESPARAFINAGGSKEARTSWTGASRSYECKGQMETLGTAKAVTDVRTALLLRSEAGG